jgi:predicted ArsR family transcriptional regulator
MSGVVWLEHVAEPTRLHIVRSLCGSAEATAQELAGDSCNYYTLRRHLDALVAAGVVSERSGMSDGQTLGRPPARFSLHPEIRESVALALTFTAQRFVG